MAAKKTEEVKQIEPETIQKTEEVQKVGEIQKPEEVKQVEPANPEAKTPPDDAGDADPDADDEPTVKSNFERLSIRAVCPDGTPFTGGYGSLRFDDDGKTDCTVADKDSLEDLRNQFPALEIKQT